MYLSLIVVTLTKHYDGIQVQILEFQLSNAAQYDVDE